MNTILNEVLSEQLTISSPINGETLSSISITTKDEFVTIVNNAKTAYKTWSKTTLRERSHIFYKYRQLLIENIDELAQLAHKENGKTLAEAKAEVDKAIEVTEFACAMPQLSIGEISEVSNGITCTMTQEPLGVVANITPFNFPIMVPHWTLSIAMMCGNTLIMKPSEIVPLSMIRCAELLKEAGLPEHVFQLVQGGKDIVEQICDHPSIKAVSFVGSTNVAKIVYQRATSQFKRALCMGGAKNHILVLPDAQTEMTANNVAASMSGCAGQRCMAASAMVGVGEIDHIVNKIVEEAKQIIPGKNLGAVISLAAKERIENYIQDAVNEGATLLLDGRNPHVEGCENGYYVGPTILDNVRPEMKIAKEEVFGPVLSIIRTSNVNDAISVQHGSDYGNGAAVFTQNGKAARDIAGKLKAGMVGINIGVPVPREPYSFGGWNDSKFGVGDITGKSSIQFWTELKKVTSKWNPEDQKDWMS